MESKTLPVIYIEISPEGSVIWDNGPTSFKLVSGGVDRSLLMFHVKIEPYIPVARVKEMIAERRGGGHCCRSHVESALDDLIADVAKD